MTGITPRSKSPWVVVLPVAACVAVTAPTFWRGDSETIRDASAPETVGLTVLWCLPLLWLAWGCRTALVNFVGSAAYVVIAAVTLNMLYESTGSTAAIGLFVIPVYLLVGVAVVLGVERVAVRKRHDQPNERRRTHDPSGAIGE